MTYPRLSAKSRALRFSTLFKKTYGFLIMRNILVLLSLGFIAAACSPVPVEDSETAPVDPVTCTTQFTKAGAVEVCQ